MKMILYAALFIFWVKTQFFLVKCFIVYFLQFTVIYFKIDYFACNFDSKTRVKQRNFLRAIQKTRFQNSKNWQFLWKG